MHVFKIKIPYKQYLTFLFQDITIRFQRINIDLGDPGEEKLYLLKHMHLRYSLSILLVTRI